jgi:hypothetical protein
MKGVGMGNPAKTSFTLGEVVTGGENLKSSGKTPLKQVGAIWEREAKNTKKPFYKIRLDLDNDSLKVALASGKPKLEFVAFKNDRKEDGDNKPNYKVYLSRD